MNKSVFITVICLASCAQQPKPTPQSRAPSPSAKTEDTILITIHEPAYYDDSDYVRISTALEKAPVYNRLLAAYVKDYRYGPDTPWSKKRLDSVVDRPSFIKTILLFQGKKAYKGISYSNKDEQYKLEDFADGILCGFRDSCIDLFYVVADTLLTQDNFKGVESLWSEADLNRLPSFDPYVNRVDTGNFFQQADLAVFFHNRHLYLRRDACMTRAKKLANFHKEYLQVMSLFKKKHIEYIDYTEMLYGDYRL
jgi:hypothetical protein